MSTPTYRTEDVLRLAPDQASARAVPDLARRGVWSGTGATATLLWGRCQGSGREPYKVTVDLTEPAFSCDCPSRKHPCKHGLALLYRYAAAGGATAAATAEEEAAGFARSWAEDRAERAAKAAVRAARAESPPDPEAQARRRAAREATMDAGLEDFSRWAEDLVRGGLASARSQPFSFWDTAAARLVDAQLPGLADRVRALPELLYGAPGAAAPPGTAPGWAGRLLAEISRLWLAARAWGHRHDLPAGTAADVRTILGWSRRTEEVLADGDRAADRWVVAGLSQPEEVGGIASQRTWLVGEQSGTVALILDFAHVAPLLRTPDVLGSVIAAELVLYPGSEPRRAILPDDRTVVGTTGAVPGGGSVDEALARAAAWLAENPFARRLPAALSSVTPVVEDGSGPVLVDGDGDVLPLAADGSLWPLLALSGGAPVDCFGEWDDMAFRPLAVAVDGRLVAV